MIFQTLDKLNQHSAYSQKQRILDLLNLHDPCENF